MIEIESWPLPRGHWFPDRVAKKYVVWHGTRGRTACTPAFGRPGRGTSTIARWVHDAARARAPWLVDRDGHVYNTFDDSGWIHHLGIPGTDARYDRHSVAVALANEGPLQLDGDRLYAFGQLTPNTIYNGAFLNHEWRGHPHHAQPDPEQIDAAIELTLDICRRHTIAPRFYYPSTTYAFPRCFQVATILCASNCHPTRPDLCLPDWVFEKIEDAGIPLVS